MGDGNNTLKCATTLSVGTILHSRLETNLDVDFYSIEVNDLEGTYTFLTFDQGINICSVDTTLILYDSDGRTVLSSNDNASTIDGPVPDPCSALNGRFSRSDTYYLLIRSSNTGTPKVGDYSVSLSFDADYIDLPSGVLSYWRLDNEGDGVLDHAGNHNLTGSVASTDGYFSQARGPFLRDNYFRVGHDDFAQKYFIAEVWFKTGRSVEQYIVGNVSGSANRGGWGWQIRFNLNKLRWSFCSSYSCHNSSSNTNVNDDNWHYAVLALINTSHDTKVRLYLDGVHQTNADYNATNTDMRPRSSIVIGRRRDHASRYFRGAIDDVVFWNNPPRTWSEVDQIVANRWNNGSPKYYKKKK